MDQRYIAGVDEVGYGSWAGPVMAGAVVFLGQVDWMHLLADSKVLLKKRRSELAEKIRSSCYVDYSIGSASVSEIDELGIKRATHLAMLRAISLLKTKPHLVRIDGITAPHIEGMDVETVVRGDQTDPAISAASIIAKVTRDELMRELGETFPHYNWGKNVGYGTMHHRDAMLEHGITSHHRLSYRPVAQISAMFR